MALVGVVGAAEVEIFSTCSLYTLVGALLKVKIGRARPIYSSGYLRRMRTFLKN